MKMRMIYFEAYVGKGFTANYKHIKYKSIN